MGSSLGVVRNVPAIPLAFATTLNTGVFSFTFFSASCWRLSLVGR